MEQPSVIEQFLASYQREVAHYAAVAKRCEELCRQSLRQGGIQAIVNSRPKSPERLREKLLDRQASGKDYATVEDIRADIVDLAGVRIALYFPTDSTAVEVLLKQLSTFQSAPRTFPDGRMEAEARAQGKASGYLATHYRVYLKPETLSQDDRTFSDTLIEIQVASVLMHAWSEVEHDLRYKQRSGKLSLAENVLLDGINDLVVAGEIALVRLQQAKNERVEGKDEPFESEYEVASYIYATLKARRNPPALPFITNTTILYNLLCGLQLDRPKLLKPYLERVNTVWTIPLVAIPAKVLVMLLDEDPSRYRILHETDIKLKLFTSLPQFLSFVAEWVMFITIVRFLVPPKASTSIDYYLIPIKYPRSMPILDELGLGADEASIADSQATFDTILKGNISIASPRLSDNGLHAQAQSTRAVIEKLWPKLSQQQQDQVKQLYDQIMGSNPALLSPEPPTN